MKKTFITLALLSAVSFSVQAENQEHVGLSAKHMAENDLSIGYLSYDIDGISLSGAKISTRNQSASGVYLGGAYEHVTKSVMGGTLKVVDLALFAGKQFTINNVSLAYVEGGLHFMKLSYGGNNDNTTEFEVAAGYKRALTHNLAATVGGRYMDSEFAGEMGIRYSFTEMLAVSANYTKGNDITKTGVNLNVYF